MQPPLRFCLADLESAYRQWGSNDAQASLAACLCLPVSAVRTSFVDFGRLAGPVQPPMMIDALARNGWEPREDHAQSGDQGDRYPIHGICRLQLGGPWITGVHASKAYASKYTHWIACKQSDGVCWIFDCLAGEWQPWAEWNNDTVPRLVKSKKLATGEFWLTHSWEIRRLRPHTLTKK